MPFVTESIYQNLVRSVRPDAYRERTPHVLALAAMRAAVDADLVEQMELARPGRQPGALGAQQRGAESAPAAGQGAGLRCGQARAGSGVHRHRHRRAECQELRICGAGHRLVTYQMLPDNKKLGPRFGANFPKLRAALEAADAEALAADLKAGVSVSLEVDGEQVTLAPDEVLVQTEPAEGLAVAADKLATVAVDTQLTSELRLEGLAREVVRRVQAMRKEAGFDISDRITTYYQTEGELAQVFLACGDYIKAETLSTELVAGAPPAGAYSETHKLDQQDLSLGVKQNE